MTGLIHVPVWLYSVSLAVAAGVGWFCGYIVGRDIKGIMERPAEYGSANTNKPESSCKEEKYRDGKHDENFSGEPIEPAGPEPRTGPMLFERRNKRRNKHK